MEDRELIARCIAGEAAAWEELVRRHVDLLSHTVRGSLGAAAGPAEVEDVLQALFLRLWDDGRRRLRGFEGRCRLSTWLAACARRLAIDRRRRRREIPSGAGEDGRSEDASPPSLLAELRAPGPGPEEAALAGEVEGALRRLPERDRLLLRLVYWDGASYEEAARFLGAPPNSVSPWIVRAKERLKVILLGTPPGRAVLSPPLPPSNPEA